MIFFILESKISKSNEVACLKVCFFIMIELNDLISQQDTRPKISCNQKLFRKNFSNHHTSIFPQKKKSNPFGKTSLCFFTDGIKHSDFSCSFFDHVRSSLPTISLEQKSPSILERSIHKVNQTCGFWASNFIFLKTKLLPSYSQNEIFSNL